MNGDDGQDVYVPLSELVYRQIRRAIIRGELSQGADISETALATKYGVSKTPVREALRRLSQERLVVVTPHKGATVSSVTAADLWEVYVMRSRLESLAARIAAERVTAEDASALRAVLAEMEANTHTGDRETIHRLNFALHELIWKISRTRLLSQTLSTFKDYIEMSRSTLLLTRRGGHVLLEEHSKIVHAILRKDPNRAETLMVKHLEHAIAALRSPLAERPAFTERRTRGRS